MTARLKEFGNINTHVVDIFGSVTGRDQPIMKMDKAVLLASCLDKAVFTNNDYVFFDPFCKAGEILLAAALVSMRRKSEKRLVFVDAVKRELYKSDRYFALAPDERHWLLSLRTFYGNEKSHDESFTQNIKNGAYLSETDGRLDKTKFKKELHAMLKYIKQKTGNKKIIAIGNPPYQENYKNSNNTGANPIYHFLLESLIESSQIDQFVMVIPSRWFSGGRGKSLRDFASKLKASRQIKQIYDFQKSKDIFPAVEIKGGVCFLHWSESHKGSAVFYNLEKKEKDELDLSETSIIIRDKLSRSIVKKINKKTKKYLSETAWSWNPFDLPSNYFDKNPECQKGDLIECFTKRKIKRKIDFSKLSKNKDKINDYKIACPKAVKTGGVPYRKDQIFIMKPREICAETYMVISSFKAQNEAKKFLGYLATDFVRFLVSVKKITQDITKETWSLVPCLEEPAKPWTDKELFKHFNLNKREQKHILEQVEKWAV